MSSNSTAEFVKSRDHIRSLTDVLVRVRESAERITSATNSYAAEMHQLSKDLRYLECLLFALTGICGIKLLYGTDGMLERFVRCLSSRRICAKC